MPTAVLVASSIPTLECLHSSQNKQKDLQSKKTDGVSYKIDKI